MLDNPLGTHAIDFPGSFYQHIMKAECKGFHEGAAAIGPTGGRDAPHWWTSFMSTHEEPISEDE